MAIIKSHKITISNEQDIVAVRKLARELAMQVQFSLIKQTKLMTAASELARNIYCHAKSGSVRINLLQHQIRSGIEMIFEDQGPGIGDINLAMTDGYTSASSLGLGLGGTKRLVDQFDIKSEVGKGTQVHIILWK